MDFSLIAVYMSQCVDDATCVDGRGLPNSACLQQRCVCGSNFIYESVYGTCQAKGMQANISNRNERLSESLEAVDYACLMA